MKKLTVTLLITTIIFVSCTESTEKTSDTPYKLSIKNEKAYELYKSAKIKITTWRLCGLETGL